MTLHPDVSSDITERDQPRTALITGAAGFAGRHLVQHLLTTTSWDIVELARGTWNARDCRRRTRLDVDITNAQQVTSALEQSNPDYVFHLAAATPPASSREMLAVNVAGSCALLKAVLTRCPAATVLIVGSDAEYGRVESTWLPTPECAPLRPIAAYGRSKVLQECAARGLQRRTGLSIVCVRPFNHIGPGQSDRFAVSTIARQIALAERGLKSNFVELGDADSRRDFTDVRDVVRAYVQVVLRCRPGAVYNIGSGVPRRIGDVAETLLGIAGKAVPLRSVSARVRNADVRITHCDARRLRRRTGWSPAIDIEQTLRDTLEYWRTRVATEQGCVR